MKKHLSNFLAGFLLALIFEGLMYLLWTKIIGTTDLDREGFWHTMYGLPVAIGFLNVLDKK